MRMVVACVLLLAACSSAPKPMPEDKVLSRLGHAGNIAFDQEHPEQAIPQFRAALARAHTRDDAQAIADAGFNLATAEMLAGRPRDAMRTALDLQAELRRRRLADPDFDLITATALYRLRDLPGADRIAARLTSAKKPDLVNAAWFLRGLIADETGDRTGLRTAVGALPPSADPADRDELQARLSHSAPLALRAADARRDRLDYRGMTRALALAGLYTRDPAASADLYLRAGRSAAAQGDARDARVWLQAAHERANDKSVRVVADRALQGLSSR